MAALFEAKVARTPWLGVALASLGLGWLIGAALANTRVEHITDLTLRTAAVFAVAWPVLLLDRVTTPPQWATRQWLGDSAVTAVAQGVRASFAWLVAGLLAPVGMSLRTDGMPWHGPVALTVALAMVGVWLATLHALLGALRAMGQGRKVPEALAGGGTFGPADAAQLIYAPAQGFVVGMVPVVVLTAWWGARGLEVPISTPVVIVIAVCAAWMLVRNWLPYQGPELFTGLRAVQVAHATRFATAQVMPGLPVWLGYACKAGGAGRWLGLALSRHDPLSPIVMAAVALAVAAFGPLWPLDLALVAAALGYLGATRRLALRDLDAWSAAQWLGAAQADLARAERRIGLTLAATGTLCALAAAFSGRSQLAAAALFGLGVGAWLGTALTLQLGPVPRWVGWTRATAWVVCALALGPGSAK